MSKWNREDVAFLERAWADNVDSAIIADMLQRDLLSILAKRQQLKLPDRRLYALS